MVGGSGGAVDAEATQRALDPTVQEAAVGQVGAVDPDEVVQSDDDFAGTHACGQKVE